MSKWLVVGYDNLSKNHNNLEYKCCSKTEALTAYSKTYPSFVITNIIKL